MPRKPKPYLKDGYYRTSVGGVQHRILCPAEQGERQADLALARLIVQLDDNPSSRDPWAVMKLEFLPDGSDDCPLVRLYDFSPAEVANLATAISGLAEGVTTTCSVHEVMGVQSVNGCSLVLRVGPRDVGMVRLPGPATFECVLTPDTWANVAGLIEPFVDGGTGSQWLSTDGDARWLLSRDGRW